MGVGIKRYKDPETGEWKAKFVSDKDIPYSPLMHTLFCSWAGHKWHSNWSENTGVCRCCRHRGNTGSAWEISERQAKQEVRKKYGKMYRRTFLWWPLTIVAILWLLVQISQYMQPT